MFDYIQGKLVSKRPTEAVLDVNGVGYVLKISLSTSEQLPGEGETTRLKVHLYVREDLFQLYGFINEAEREVFRGLLSISGVGPKLAQTVLSGLTPDRLVEAIGNQDHKTLSSISGIGKKTAQRLIMELGDKLGGLKGTAYTSMEENRHVSLNTMQSEAIMALMSLGYSKVQAEKAVIKAGNVQDIRTAEELIKKALQVI